VPFRGTEPWKHLGDWCQQCLGRARQDGQTVCVQCAGPDLSRNGHGRYDHLAWGTLLEQLDLGG
jgi:hypothetical protein